MALPDLQERGLLLDETPRRAGGDLCRPAISAVPTAFAQEDSDNIVVKVGVPCAQMFPPFQIGCAAGVCLDADVLLRNKMVLPLRHFGFRETP